MFDLLIQNVRLARPDADVIETDVAITDGRFARIAPGIDPAEAREVRDAGGLMAFPGLVDAHMHVGIYQPLHDDAPTESRAAAMGGVTSSLNYMRTGQYYLNKTGPHAEFFPEVLDISDGRFWVDYAYHLAPMDKRHIAEIPNTIDELGVTSFKIFMFYGGHGLHGKAVDQKAFLMIDEGEEYDIAHFEFVMRGVEKAAAERPDLADAISLSLHCETAEIMRAYTEMVYKEGKLSGLEAYSASRPPHSEGLAIFIAGYLAHETACRNINLLHLTSKKAVDAALMMQETFPHIDFRREVTIGHLLMDIHSSAGVLAKVNPPIRPREDVEYLWEHVLAGNIDWVVSDHACCRHEIKVSDANPDDVYVAKSGFGGTEYLAVGPVLRGDQTRTVTGPDRRADQPQPGPPLRPGRQGRRGPRSRRRPRAVRPRRDVHRPRRREPVAAGVHAVRGPDADGPRQDHLPARGRGVRRGRGRRGADRPVPLAPVPPRRLSDWRRA